MKIKIILYTLVSIFFISLVNANGLFVNSSIQNLQGVYGQNVPISFIIYNRDSFTFYNITLASNPYMIMPIISQLGVGQAANVTAIINSSSSFSLQSFRIQGYYQSQVGITHQNHLVVVDYNNGLSTCDQTIIKGDTVTWQNTVTDDVQLKNTNTGNVVTTIHQGQNYTTNFDTPQSFPYVFLRRGFTFTPICTITALSDTGLVNNPQYDAFLNLSLNIVFNPTTINYNIPTNNYTLNVFQSQDGILSLTNTGNNTAQNIQLSGTWMTFNTNNFNLNPGETKGIVYTIKPMLSKTNDTNKTYVQNLVVNGNFNSISIPISITVNYANLDSTNQSSNYQSLLALLEQFCADNPQETFCQNKPSIVYVGNGTDQNFNVTYSTEQVKQIYAYIFAQGDAQSVMNNYLKETLNNISHRIDDIQNTTASSLNVVSNSQAQTQQSSGNLTVTIIIFIMLAICGLIFTLILVIRKYREKNKFAKW